MFDTFKRETLFIEAEEKCENAVGLLIVEKKDFDALKQNLSPRAREIAQWSDFFSNSGKVVLLPPCDDAPARLLIGVETRHREKESVKALSKLPNTVNSVFFEETPEGFDHAYFARLFIGAGYSFDRYKKPLREKPIKLRLPDNFTDKEKEYLRQYARFLFLGRNMINTPTEDCPPVALQTSLEALAQEFGGKTKTVVGSDLLRDNFPLIHAVGRAATEQDRTPRLIDLTYGDEKRPKVTLVGKGVCYDTGGLNIKPGRGMKLMKKDMGGAATVTALAGCIMAANLPVRLRVIVPAVENALGGNAFRPGDIFPSRKGLSVEIGDTDAEGRLILADALALADEEAPDLLIDIATLTGAARVALGPDLPGMFTDDNALAEKARVIGEETGDPVWRLPLYEEYADHLKGASSDLINIASDGMAGASIAALFLKNFVVKAKRWVHFDSYCHVPTEKPGKPRGAEITPFQTLLELVKKEFTIEI